MNLTDIISRVRMNCTIEDDHPDYTDAWIGTEYNDALSSKLSEMIMESKSGYWLQFQDFTTTVGQPCIRVPPRALILSKLEMSMGGNGSFCRLPEVFEGHADLFNVPSATTGRPRGYVLRGDQIWLMPPPDNSGYTIRVWYFIRPSIISRPQSTGVIDTNIDRVNRIIPFVGGVAGFPHKYINGVDNGLLITTTDLVDIIHPDGWHELAIVSAPFNSSANTITLAPGTDMSRVQIGDVVRLAGYSDWPPIPDDFHRMLCDIVSSKILVQLENNQKAASIFQDGGADMARFSRLISDRTLEEPRTLRPYFTGSLGRYIR